jgi:hypothetical protein
MKEFRTHEDQDTVRVPLEAVCQLSVFFVGLGEVQGVNLVFGVVIIWACIAI